MIQLKPTETEYIEAWHEGWQSGVRVQFPEMVIASDAVVKVFWEVPARWRQTGDQSWSHEWRGDDRYLLETRPRVAGFDAGKPIYDLITGMTVRADMAAVDGHLEMIMTLTNESERTFERVMCEGGCLQPGDGPFRLKHDDTRQRILSVIERSFISCDGRMISMAELPRTRFDCCAYQFDPAGYEQPIELVCEGMWGRSEVHVDAPTILGMVSIDRTKAYVIGYEHSVSGLHNGSERHCLHSRPEYGDIEPGQSVSRTGYILFGDDLESLADRLREMLRQL